MDWKTKIKDAMAKREENIRTKPTRLVQHWFDVIMEYMNQHEQKIKATIMDEYQTCFGFGNDNPKFYVKTLDDGTVQTLEDVKAIISPLRLKLSVALGIVVDISQESNFDTAYIQVVLRFKQPFHQQSPVPEE